MNCESEIKLPKTIKFLKSLPFGVHFKKYKMYKIYTYVYTFTSDISLQIVFFVVIKPVR